MQRFENVRNLFLRDGKDCAYAAIFPANTGYAELWIACYRFGHKAEADAVGVKGGKLSAHARTAPGLFSPLCRAITDKWRGQKLFVSCPDERRFRVYCALLRKAGLTYEAFEAGLSINIYL